MKLIMENWRSFLSEEQKPVSGWAFGAEPLDNKQVASLNQKIKSDREKELKAALSQGTKDQWAYALTKRKSKEQIVADMIVLLDPTGQIGEINIDDKTKPFLTTTAEQINRDLEKIEKLEGRMKALEKHSKEWYGLELEKVALYSAVGLGMAAAVPVVGKIAKAAAKSQKTQKFARSAADIARRSLIASKVTGRMINNSIEALNYARLFGNLPPEHIRKYRGWNNFPKHYEEELLNAELSYKEIEVKLPSSGQMKNYIEKNREMGRLGYVDDGSRKARKRIRHAQASGISDEILKKVSLRTHPSLNKYKFSRLKPEQFPKTVYHGSRTNQLSIDKISPIKRPRGKDAFDAHWSDAAGFYTHSLENMSYRYATGKKATMYSFQVNPNAKVYAYTPPKGEKYQDGWHFIRLNNKDIQALRKKGVDALYDKVADEFIIIGDPKKVFSKIKSKPVNN